MRKSAVLFLTIVGSVTFTKAQTLVPRIGITSSTSTVEKSELTTGQSTGSVTGISVALGYNVPVANLGKLVFSLQPEVNYIQKGSSYKSDGEFQIGEAIYKSKNESKQTLNYLEFPVLARFEYDLDKIKVGLFAGPAVAFGLDGKYKFESKVDNGETVEVHKSEGKVVFYDQNGEENTSSLDHNVDFSLQAGAVVTILKRVQLDVRYGHSLTNKSHYVDSKNRVLQFSVGVPISL
ncbi:porin family protein [Pseudochryseolinea flava]|uniref:Outer membrane protein beta-barrel domain-containing protein n=1 Tax=Pseudochryseolinea flava TaxID=2059302 RepID=A0A364Y080_9BACT|nr:porin family protein [Pseudochryseolinea flava]RAV99128.1 hypothetical protein DQQ10_21275 [Pseudochryseolinea flava]